MLQEMSRVNNTMKKLLHTPEFKSRRVTLRVSKNPVQLEYQMSRSMHLVELCVHTKKMCMY